MELVSSPSSPPPSLPRLRPRLDIGAMKLILDGLNPVGRRVLILLPWGNEPVGVRISTIVENVSRCGLEFQLMIKVFTDKTGLCACGNLRFNLHTRKLVAEMVQWTGENPKKPHAEKRMVTTLVECFMVLDTVDGMTVHDLFQLYRLQFPNACEVFVE